MGDVEDKKIFQWAVVGHTIVSWAVAGAMPAEQLQGYIAAIETHDIRFALAMSYGTVSLTATQRRDAAGALKTKGVETLVVTESRLVRGVVTAVSWLGANAKAFSWENLDDAIARLKLGASDEARIREIAKELYGENASK